MMRTKIIGFVILAVFQIANLPVHGQKVEGTLGPLSADEIRTVIERAPREEDRPDLDALVLFDGVYIDYADGLATVRRQRLVKIYTEWAVDHLGDPRLAYDRGRQELEIHASRTYLLDGSTMDTPDNGFNEVTPRGLDLSVDHLNIREMVVTHVGIERGVSILLDYSVRDLSPRDFPFNRIFFLHDEFAALEKELVAEGDLRGETVNPVGGLFTLPSPEGRSGALVWHAEDLPARPRHAHHRLGDQVPWIALAASRSWIDLLGGLDTLIDAAAVENGMLGSILTDMGRDTPFLSDRETLERLADEVMGRTALVRYHPWLFTPLPRSVAHCLERSTATPVERCAILLAGCRRRNLDADLILPGTGIYLSQAVPALEAVGDPLLRVDTEESETWWIDPMEGTVTAQPPIRGGVPYFVINSGGVDRATSPVTESRVLVSVFWDLEVGEGKAEGFITGPVAKTLDWEEPEKLIQGWAEGWCDSAEVTELRVLASSSEGLSYALSAAAPLPSPDDRGRTVVDLPLAPGGIGDLLPEGMNLAHSEVDGILFPPAPATVHLKWTIRPPEGLVILPGPAIDMEWEDASLGVRRTESGSQIEIEYDLTWGGRSIIPEEYSGYRSLFLEASDPRFTRLVFAEE
jgi:hypothetical protein